MDGSVTFFLNGRAVTLEDPSPDLLLIDYLRSPAVGLVGPKKPCGEGGCGGCTVILSRWDPAAAKPEHRAINSCLRPVCALDGLVVTTVEGTGAVRRPNPPFLKHTPTFSRGGAPIDAPTPPAIESAQDAALAKRESVQRAIDRRLAREPRPAAKLLAAAAEAPSERSHEGMNPVAYRLALNNGSQCGYCSVGFVMNMSEFITNRPKATKREIEDALDGNLCRCTGYRPILTGMKTFASNWTEEDERERMKCLLDPGSAQQLPADVAIPFPEDAHAAPRPVRVEADGRVWLTPATLRQLAAMMREHRGKKLRLVHGNTSYGVYKSEYLDAGVLVDIRLIPELSAPPEIGKQDVRVAAGISYSDLIDTLEAAMRRRGEVAREGDDEVFAATTCLGAVHFMARRTAGRIVRNAASLGGNTMLVLAHIAGTSEASFPSDAMTAIVAVGAEIDYLDLSRRGEGRETCSAEELVKRVRDDPGLADQIVLLRYRIPAGSKDDLVMPQKVALREVNAHAIVNATSRIRIGKDLVVDDVAIVFGNIAPFPWRARKTEAAMKGETLSLDMLPKLASICESEVRKELARWEKRYRDVPDEGFTDEYKTELATAFLYKCVVHALAERGANVPGAIRSCGEVTWGRWPVSGGVQEWARQDWRNPVALPYIKTMAMYQASGQVHYTHELPAPPSTLEAAMVQSRRALANFEFVLPNGKKATAAALRAFLRKTFPSFVDLITAADLPQGGINEQGMGGDQPLFATGLVGFAGQCLALVLARTEREAVRIADYVSARCVSYGPVTSWPKAWRAPIVSLEDAIRKNSVFPDNPSSASFVSHIWKITRPGSRFDWTTPNKDPLDRAIVDRPALLDGVPCRVVENTLTTGGQIHFYMEPQGCLAEPLDAKRLVVHPSTQSPQEMHVTTAMALGVEYNRIEVQVPLVGGGFGGKTEQARFVVGPTTVAAYATKRPVRLAMPREHDSALIGKRHAYYGQYQIAVDRGELRAEDRGRILGWQTKLWGDGGFFYDCSFIVSNCIQTRADCAYRVPHFESEIDVCRTNRAPNTAFRSFGDVQAKTILENAIDDAAFSIGMLPEDLREKNLYVRGEVTPFGQALSYCYLDKVWAYLKDKSKYATKRAEVDAFNAANKWRKRGLAMIPVKYGSGYNLVMLEQAMAMVSVYQADGSVIIQQGGVEIGQGLTTQVTQVAAYILNVPMELVQVQNPKTDIIPTPTSTGASTGTTYNVEAVKQVCQVLRARLMEFGHRMLKEHGDDWCRQFGIDFWNHGAQGWSARVEPTPMRAALIWQNLVGMAYRNRVGLVEVFTAPMRGGETPMPALTFKPPDRQPRIPGITRVDGPATSEFDSFTGFTYSAACSVVEVDVLTGETKILSADIVYDMGWSLNPAIDIGQVEGAFIQGVGFLTSEQLVFQPDGDEKGRLNTLNTWTYKIPAQASIPLEMNTWLFPRDRADVPEEPTDIMSAKEVGEPPLVLGNAVFFAIKAAIRASRLERGLPGLFRFDAPATVQEVRRACEVSVGDFQ
ncbi:MAG: molybdopterin cofactor-binding domain-containing protein [Thermoanaerobaculia bacterium]